jgi:hypothetical protein
MGGAAASWFLLMAAELGSLSLPSGESSRPRICSPGAATASADASAARRGPWDRVREQPFERLCLGLARSQIRLSRDPAAALELARRLAREWPSRPEPRVLEARALVAAGDFGASWQAWQAAVERGQSLGREPGTDPVSAHALRDYALSAALTGHVDVASTVYRRLVSLLDAWPDPRHVQRLYLEAAAASLRRGSAHSDEAIGYLLGAQRSARSTSLRAYTAGMLALVRAQRSGKSPEPAPLDAPEVWHFVELARGSAPPSHWPMLPRHEVAAVASVLIERYSLTEAAELWNTYSAGLEQSAAEATLLAFARERQARLQAAEGRAP